MNGSIKIQKKPKISQTNTNLNTISSSSSSINKEYNIFNFPNSAYQTNFNQVFQQEIIFDKKLKNFNKSNNFSFTDQNKQNFF